MSTASFSSSRRVKRVEGFSREEFQSFLSRGNQLTNPGATNGKKIGAFKPQKKERIEVTTGSKAGGLARAFGAKNEGTTTVLGGFLGEFASGVTSAQLDSLTNSFLQRQRSIQQRRAQPGRSALFLSRT